VRKDFLITLIGIASGQLVMFVAMPYLARVYTPAEFGSYALISSLAAPLSVVAALRYNIAIPAAEDKDIEPLTRVAFFLPLFVVPLLTLVLYAFSDELNKLGVKALMENNGLFILCVVSVLQGIMYVANGLCVRKGWFSSAAIIRMSNSVGFVIAAILLVNSLVSALVIAWCLTGIIALYVIWRVPLFTGWINEKDVVKRYWRYPIFSAPVAWLDTLSLSLPVMFITAQYGEEVVGNYSQVLRLMGAPLIMVSASVGQIFFKYAGDEYRNKKQLSRILRKTVLQLFCFVLVVAVCIYLIGEVALSWFLGAQWSISTMFIMLAMLPVFIRVTVSPVSTIFMIVNKVGLGSGWQVLYFISTILVLTWAQRNFELQGFLVVLIFNELIMYAIYLLLATKVASKQHIGA